MGLFTALRRLLTDQPPISMDLTPMSDLLAQYEALDQETFESAATEEIARLTDRVGGDLAMSLLRDPERSILELRKFRSAYENRLLRSWDPALATFDLMQTLCVEFGEEFGERFFEEAAASEDWVFEALTRLHGRACLTASEIGALLRTGHATGANARWRTLSEVVVTAMFIAQHGTDVARRYVEHQAIETYKGAKLLREFANDLGEPTLEDSEFEVIERERNSFVEKYGSEFGDDFGWAAEALKPVRANFREIRRATDMDHWAAQIRTAGHGIHSGSKGAYFDLGLHPDLEGILPGASQFGLAEPAGNTLTSLLQITVALFTHKIGSSEHADALVFDFLMMSQLKALQAIADYGIYLFVEIQQLGEEVPPVSSPPPKLWESPDLSREAEPTD